MFRYKKSIPVSYEWQGYIYFTSLLYWELPKLGRRAAGESARAAPPKAR